MQASQTLRAAQFSPTGGSLDKRDGVRGAQVCALPAVYAVGQGVELRSGTWFLVFAGEG